LREEVIDRAADILGTKPKEKRANFSTLWKNIVSSMLFWALNVHIY